MKRCLVHMRVGITAALPLLATASDRFPKPDFDQAYTAPELWWPTAGTFGLEMLDAALLTLALSVAAYLALKQRSRRGLVILGIINLLYFGFYRKGCLCPVGALQPLVQGLASGQAVTLGAVLFFVLPLLFALMFGRVFCAAVCPLGVIQDLVAVRPQRLSRPLQAGLRLLPVIYLAVAILLAATGTAYLICRYDPFVPFFRLSGTPSSVLLGGLMLLLGIVLARPYCRFLCPYGVLLGWFSKLSWRHVSITPDTCITCKLCADSCPFDAIEAPTPEKPPEALHRGVRRMLILIVSAPLLIALSGWTMARVAPRMALLHQDSRTATDLRLEAMGTQTPTIETAAYRLTDRDTQELLDADTARRQRLGRAGGWAGALIGLVLVCRLLAASTRRQRTDYVPQRSLCLSCGRCFRYCPKDHIHQRIPLKEGS